MSTRFSRLLSILVVILAFGCTAPDPMFAKKEELKEDAAGRNFKVTQEPVRNEENTAWLVHVVFGDRGCYGKLTYGDDGSVTMRGFVSKPGGDYTEHIAQNPYVHSLDPAVFDVCFSEK